VVEEELVGELSPKFHSYVNGGKLPMTVADIDTDNGGVPDEGVPRMNVMSTGTGRKGTIKGLTSMFPSPIG